VSITSLTRTQFHIRAHSFDFTLNIFLKQVSMGWWCLRRLLRLSYLRHVANVEVLRLTCQTQLSTTQRDRRLRLFGHIARADSRIDHIRALRSIISGLPRDWKRPPGRPRRTWLRTIEQDLRPLNIGFLCQLGNGLRIVNGGNGQWKRLRSRLGHAVDDDDDEISMTY